MGVVRACTVRSVAISVLLGSVFQLVAAAGGSPPPLPRFERRTVADGLSNNAVRDTLVDADGFLWLATDDGLNRSDGVATRVYRFQAESGRRNRILSLAQAPADGGIWIGTDHGVYRLPPGADRFEPVETEIDLVASLLRDPAGRIWAGGMGRLVRFTDGVAEPAIRCVTDSPGPRHLVRDIVEGDDGTIWALFLEHDTLQPIVAAVHPDTLDADCLRPPERGPLHAIGIADGRLWVGRHRAAVTGGRLGAFEPIPGLEGSGPLTAFAAGPDRIWLGTASGGFQWDASRERAVPVDAIDPQRWLRGLINAIRVDPWGGVWLSTLGGVLHWDPRLPQFQHLELATDPVSGSRGGASVSAFVLDGPRLWVGAFDAGLFEVDLASRSARSVGARWDEAGCSASVWALTLEERGDDGPRLWVGTEDGLCALDTLTGRVSRWTMTLPSTHERRIKRVLLPAARDTDRSLWLLLNAALARFDPVTRLLRIVEPPQGVSVQGFQPIDALMLGDDLWVGMARGELLRIGLSGAQSFRLRSATGAPLLASVLDLHAADDALLLGTSNGLLRFDPRDRSTRPLLNSDALPSSVVYSVIEEPGGALWLGTAAGLVRYEPDLGPRSVRRYGPQQGVLSLEFNRHASLAGGGRLFFGGDRGLTWIAPDGMLPDTAVPRVILDGADLHGPSSVRSVGRRHDGPLIVAPGEENVVVHYAAPALVNAASVTYRHRLSGLSGRWQDAGSDRVARYTGVPPGRYVFEAQAGNGNGDWGPVARWPVVVRPRLLESRWFRAAIGLIVGLTCAFALYLRRRTRRQIERLRIGIASDLHDDIGSELAGIALAAGVSGRDPTLSTAQREALLRINGKARTMLEAIRHVVWSIDPIHDNTQSLVERMRAVARDLLVASTWSLDTNLPASPRRLDTLPRRSLFLAFKELLHNVARHARASEVTISLKQNGGLLELTVTDDGVGFDPEPHREGRSGGMGLRGLRHRALAVGGRFQLDSGVGTGTRAVFAVPTRALGGFDSARRRRADPGVET